MKNLLNKKLCVTAVATFLLVFGSSFSYGNNLKKDFKYVDEYFDGFDKNYDGFIDKSEMKLVIFGANPPALLPSDLLSATIITLFDTDANGKLDEEEWDNGGGLVGIVGTIRTFLGLP